MIRWRKSRSLRGISLIISLAMIGGMGLPKSAQAQTWDSVSVTATVISPENTFPDTWNFYSLASGGSWEGWNQGEVTSDGEGNIIRGSLISHEGLTTLITGGTYAVPKVGVVEADFISSKGNIDFKGGMNSQWDVVIGVESSPGPDYGWDMLIKSTREFAQSDFWGSWSFYSLASGGSWEGWKRGTIVGDARGNITGGLMRNSKGDIATIIGGTYTIDANGAFLATVNTSEGTMNLKGSMNDSRDIVGGVDDPPDANPELWALVKSTATFVNKNFSGKWDLKAVTSDGSWQGWRDGTIEADNAGGITGGTFKDNKGNTVVITGGTYTIDTEGAFIATVRTSDGKATSLRGAMNDSKDVAVSVSEANASLELGLAGMTRISPSDSGPRKPYLLIQDQETGSSDYTRALTVDVTLDVKNGTQYKLSENWNFADDDDDDDDGDDDDDDDDDDGDDGDDDDDDGDDGNGDGDDDGDGDGDDGNGNDGWISAPFPLSTTYTFAEDVDETKVLYVRYRNNAGLESPTVSDEIVLDRVPPTLEGITLSDRSNGSTDKTNEHIVNVAVDASDGSGSPKEIMLSENKKFKDAEWIDFSPQVTFFLSGEDGKKTVYAKVRDGAGWENVTEGKAPVNDTIELDTTPPSEPGDFIAVWIEPTKDVDLSWKNPPQKDFVYTLIRRKTGSFPLDIDDGTLIYQGRGESITDTVPEDGVYYYRAWAFDDIENVSTRPVLAAVSVNGGPIPEPDKTAPYLTRLNPSPGENFVPWDTNIFFHIRDDESPVDRGSVSVSLTREDGTQFTIVDKGKALQKDGEDAYYDVQLVVGPNGSNGYIVSYDPEGDFKYEEEVTVTVAASDLTINRNTLNYSYKFTTHTMVIGSNILVEDEARRGVNLGRPSIAVDSSGKNIYVAWEEYNGTNFEVYSAKSANRGASFGRDVKVSGDLGGADQRRPQIAIDNTGTVYVVWQEKGPEGNWSVYLAKSTEKDILRFGRPLRISGADMADQTQPTIDAKSARKVYVAWVETEGDNSSIYFANSFDGGTTFQAPERVDDGLSRRPSFPSLRISPPGDVFITWQAEASEINHIYFDSNRSGSFGADIRVSAGGSDATGPSLDVTPNGKDVYVAWTNETDGDKDIYFAKISYKANTKTFEVGENIRIDDDSGTHSQSDPSVVVDSSGDAFIAWRDMRNDDGDIYIAISNTRGATFKANVLINRDSSAAIQAEPRLALDASGRHLNVCWTDYRGGRADVYFAKNMTIENSISVLVRADEPERTITADVGNGLDGMSITIPPGALEVDTTITMGEISGIPPLPADVKGIRVPVAFGPGGTTFNRPVTIRIPYSRGDLDGVGFYRNYYTLDFYLYNHITDSWEKLGGSVFSDYVEVQVNHFSIFSLGGIGGIGGILSASAVGAECFIATATYGTEMAEEVEYLRRFRDAYLLTNRPGRKFVELYCKFSPPIADYISKRERLKSIVRKILRPFVWFSKIMTE